MREADIAIRMKEPSQADLIRRRLMDVNIRLYASPEYLAKHGMPQTPAELAKHRLICQSPTAPQVSAGAGWMAPYLAANETSLLTVNNYFGILQAVRSGLGVGALPDYLTADSPYCPKRAAAWCRSIWPIPKNCAIPNAWRCSAILS